MPEGANLIISNHVTNVDFLMLAIMTSGRFMSFVIAENAMRKQWLKKLVYLIDKPIIHTKGTKSLNTIQEMSKRLKAGDNVMIFPEGNTCFDGTTAKMEKSIGKLAKMCNSNLVIYRIRGGYFTMPRWGKGIRRGKVALESKVYKAEELKNMNALEVTKAINDFLAVDAYADQESEKIEFKNSKPCLGLERAMYRCPGCGEIGSLKSDSNSIGCNCGYLERFDKYGFLLNSEENTNSIKSHLQNQRKWLKEKIYAESAANEGIALFEDAVDVYKVNGLADLEFVGRYTIRAFSDCIKYIGADDDAVSGTIRAKSIRSVVIFGANTLTAFVSDKGDLDENIKTGETVYEIHGDFSFNALKYRDLFEVVSEV